MEMAKRPPRAGEPESAHRPDEHLVIELRRHGLGLLGTAVRLAIIAAVTGYLLGSVSQWLAPQPAIESASQWLIMVIGGALMYRMVLRRFARWSIMRAGISHHRVKIRYQFRRQGWDIPLLTIVDVSYQAGMLQRLFGTGSLIITTNFARQPAVIPDVAHVADVRQSLLELRAEAWTSYQRSLAMQPHRTAVIQAAS